MQLLPQKIKSLLFENIGSVALIVSKKESGYKAAKKYRSFKISIKHYTKDFFLILIGVLSATLGLKGFLIPNQFLDGGATGMSLLTSTLTGIPVYLLIICINIPFIVLGYVTLGKSFAIKTALAITTLS